MKVIQLLPALGVGGVELHVVEIVEALTPQGFDFTVVSDGGPLEERITAAGAKTLRLPVRRKSLASLGAAPKLRQLFAEADIVHAHSRLPAWLARLALIAARPRPRFVTTFHGLYSVNAYSAVMASGDVVAAVSETAAAYARENFRALRDKLVAVIPGSVDPAAFHRLGPPDDAWRAGFEAEHPETMGKRLFLMPGRMTRLKGHAEAVRALARTEAEDAHVVFAGSVAPGKARYAAEIEALAVELGVRERVSFLGARPDLPQLLAHSTALLSLNSKPESFGRTVLEALAVGTPVYGYAHGGVGELLAALYPEGRLEPGDAAGLARRLAETPPPPPPIPPFYEKAREMRQIADLYRAAAHD